jgi:hypothetical protein
MAVENLTGWDYLVAALACCSPIAAPLVIEIVGRARARAANSRPSGNDAKTSLFVTLPRP